MSIECTEGGNEWKKAPVGHLLTRSNMSNRSILPRSPRRTYAGRAFSLITLTVVIGIIAVLIGLLMPTLSKGRAQAKSVQCQSNLRQLGVMLQTHVNDNNGSLF